MPVTRNERRYLGDGSKAAEQTIERAQRRGQLESRSKTQLESKLQKLGPDITWVFLGYKEIAGNLTSSKGETGTASARLSVESDNLTPVLGGGGGVEAGAASAGGLVAAAPAAPAAGGSVAGAVAAAAGGARSRGRGARGARGGGGRGGRARGRGIAASAKPID
jgi:hypothetical protein